VSQSSKCKRTRQGVCSNGKMVSGSWFTQSSLSIYGDDHVITIWWLYVLKHKVERSTHICFEVTLVVRPRVWTSHSIISHFSLFTPQIKDALYTIFITRCLCRLSPRTPFTHIHHTLKGKHILSTSAMVYKYLCFHNSPIYLHLVVLSTSWHDRQGILYR
jgi:hypothetical protein